jgi:two-component system, sensor histidine kinase
VVGQVSLAPEGAAPPGAPLILLIEDNRDIRDSAKTVLEHLGHRVAVAADGLDGVAKAVALRPRVALVDIGLPRLDGYAVARSLRAALGRAITLVAYTAYGDPEDRERALGAGFDLHVVKPIDWGVFGPLLGRLVEEVGAGAP